MLLSRPFCQRTQHRGLADIVPMPATPLWRPQSATASHFVDNDFFHLRQLGASHALNLTGCTKSVGSCMSLKGRSQRCKPLVLGVLFFGIARLATVLLEYIVDSDLSDCCQSMLHGMLRSFSAEGVGRHHLC
jgi:hypothetical protein